MIAVTAEMRRAWPTPDPGSAKSIMPSLPAEAQAFVILVLTPQGKYRRKVYLSLHSAVLAVQRAEARGQSAQLVLCRLEPVESLLSGSEGDG